MRKALLLALSAATIALTACGHKKHARLAPPPPPPASAPPAAPARTPASAPPAATARANPPINPPTIGETETGIASWYGHPYHGRQAADGEIYDMETLVAAHRTLPFNTWVRVVNLRNDKVVEVRIIDRGPFIEGRIIDLSHAAARDIDLIGPGIGPVRIEVIRPPASGAVARASAASPPAASALPNPVPSRSGRAALAPAPTVPVPSPSGSAPASPVTAAPVNSARTNTSATTANVEAAAAGAFAVQVGIYFDRASAERVRAGMASRYGSARIVRREGDREMWRVLVGSESSENAANAISDRIRQDSGERITFVVRLDSY